ncbi:MAG: hypothetical protein SPE09_06680 [Alloprevotella sp.]|nr:hypothetical protein [Alloprevotella sp.]
MNPDLLHTIYILKKINVDDSAKIVQGERKEIKSVSLFNFFSEPQPIFTKAKIVQGERRTKRKAVQSERKGN